MPRAGLEPARPFGPEDFLTTITFATCRSIQVRQFVVWTMPSPCMFHCLPYLTGEQTMFRREPSRLYTLLVSLALARRCHSAPFSGCCEGFAEFDSIHAGVSIRRAQITSNNLSPLCLPFHHPGRAVTSLSTQSSSCKRRVGQ